MSHTTDPFHIQWDDLQDEPLHTPDKHDPLSDKNNEPAVLNSQSYMSESPIEDNHGRIYHPYHLSQMEDDSSGSSVIINKNTIRIHQPRKETEQQSTYISYLVESERGSVRRRYQDFVWLYNVLYTAFPACFIPPLPHKHRLGDRFNHEFIERRRISLERFIQRIWLHPILGHSDYFTMFLASKEFNDASARASREGQSTMLDTIGDTLLNAFTKIRKPDPRFVEMRERCDRMEENLDLLQRTLLRTNKRQSELQADYEEFTESVRGLAEIEPAYRDFLVQFADTLEAYAHQLKQTMTADEEWQIEINDYMAYYNEIKGVLKLRDQKQLDFEELTMYVQTTIDEREKLIRDKSEGMTSFITGKINEARGADSDKLKREKILRLDERIRELQEAVEQTHEINTAFSEQVKKEDAYFNRNKCIELYNVLQTYSETKINHYQESVNLWRNLVQQLENNSGPSVI